ncbi:MAG: hypothetical protein LBQ46_10805 [Treponema sp.]|jgi:hypothetical protein|nr:hypothetical protein [Treponema sp.]
MEKLEIDPIKAKYFYDNEEEKIKINWFCYEYAFILYSHLKNSDKLKKYRKNNTQEQITNFCVYFSKEMKKSIYEKLGGLVEATTFYEKYVEQFYPDNTSRENLTLLNTAAQAWDELLGSCVVCPNRCISEMNRKCSLFDEFDDDDEE